ncbi:MAG: cyanophycinase [Candidatus Sulfotelmatobacter sp.]
MKRFRLLFCKLPIALLIEISLLLCSALADSPHYKYFRAGNSADARTKTEGGFALLGGGKDIDRAFKWMCERSGGGDFLVLRARGDDAYNPYIQGLCHVNSVSTLVIPDRMAASDPFVATTIRRAGAVFIAGGDQANYINFWMGTPVQEALNEALSRNIPIGGTSAGLAVLGEFVYSAQGDLPDEPDLSSSETLSNPFDPRVTIVHQFLNIPLLKDVITDTHFFARDRMGRTLVFMARILQDGRARRIRDIAVDQGAGVLLDPDGTATVVGDGSAYFLEAIRKPEICKANTPLTFRAIAVRTLRTEERFNVRRWSSDQGVAYILSVESGAIHSTLPGGAVYTNQE